jgi:putative ABC transport system permease protein
MSPWRRRTERERLLDAELRDHVERLTADYVAAGMPDADARRRALLEFGGVEQVKEASRDQRRLGWLEDFARDVVHGLRGFRRSPGFAAAAVLTLALGIGANTAIFSIVNGVLLKPLPYPQPEQLMYLTTRFPGLGFSEFWVSPPEYLEFREINRSFAAVGAFSTGEVNVAASDRPRRARASFVDEHLLTALGVRPAAGRLFGPGETDQPAPTDPGGPPTSPPLVALLSHELWQTAFGAQPIVGRTIDVDGVRLEVVGVLEPGADVMDSRTEIWLPLGLSPANRENRGNHYLYLVGRLADGVTAGAAEAELADLAGSWAARTGRDPAFHVFGEGDGPMASHALQMAPLADELLGGVRRSIWVLQAAVALVLLIACANVASLLLARAETRRREVAVLTALGAGRGRLLRKWMTESVMLSAVGGVLGVLLAGAALQVLLRTYPASLPRTGEIALDLPVLFFTLGVATAGGLLFGLAPAAYARVTGLVATLKEAGARSTAGASWRGVRVALVAGEIALAIVVVTGAGLLLRTVQNLSTVDAGFDRSRLVTFSVTLPPATYQAPDRARAYQEILRTLRAVPGVLGATAMTGLPPDRPLNANSTDIENYEAPPDGPFELVDYYQNVTTDYFETMGIPLVEGRGFQRADAVSDGLVAVVNERLADTFWPGRSPIGQRLRPGTMQEDDPWFTVVGVAKDVKQGGVDQETGSELYFFFDQVNQRPGSVFGMGAAPTMNVVVRTTRPVSALAGTIERLVGEVDPGVPVVRLREMDAVFAESIRRPRLLADLVGTFAVLALLLAAIGTYGVLAYIAAERRREVGIRLALGARRTSVLLRVMTLGLLPATLGVVIGLAGALAVTRLLDSLLFGVRADDPVTLLGVVASMALVSAVACGLPAWRAARVDPSVVLRDE